MSLLSDEQAQKIFQSEHCNISKDLAGILYRAIEAAVLEAQGKQKPVAWLARGIHGGKAIAAKLHDYKQDADNTASVFLKHYGAAETVPLYAAPVVQPDMVMVPREPSETIVKAMEQQWMCGSQIDMAKREYRAMIAAAEGK